MADNRWREQELEGKQFVHRPEIVGGERRPVDPNDGGWHFQAHDWQDRHVIDRFGHEFTHRMVRRRAQRMGTGVNVSSRTLILEHELQDGERAAGSMNELIAQHEVMFGRPPIEEDLRRTMSRMTSLKRREFIPRDLVSTVFGQWRTCEQSHTLIPTENIN